MITTSGIILYNPKFPHNVGATVRACSCFGIPNLFWTGDRMTVDGRLPREERMKGYRDVTFRREDRPFSQFAPNVIPVAIELLPGSESIVTFEHPANAVYVFGPEDGSIPAMIRRHCHRFLYIPSHHCLNLSAAVNVVLYDRRLKRQTSGAEPIMSMTETLHETRGLLDCPAMSAMGWDGK